MTSVQKRLSILVLLLVIFGSGFWLWRLYSDIDSLPVGDANRDMARRFAGNREPGRKVPHPVWKPASAGQRQAAARSITAQLEDFKKDNWAGAAKYQCSDLQRNFPSVEQFQRMIEGAYPEFADYKKVIFKTARAYGNYLTMEVELTGQNGKKVRAMYSMVKEDGIYKIQGVAGGATHNSPPPEDMTNLV